MNVRTWVVTGFVSAGVAVAVWVGHPGRRTPCGGGGPTDDGRRRGDLAMWTGAGPTSEIEVRVEGRATDAPGRYSQPEAPGAEAGAMAPRRLHHRPRLISSSAMPVIGGQENRRSSVSVRVCY
jgi:hypothetical protein